MTIFYRSYRVIIGKCRWIVIDEDYNKILNPTMEQLKMAISKDPPKRCCKCRHIVTYINTDGIEDWRKHECSKENCTRYLCKKCYMKEYHNRPDSDHNITKQNAQRRLGNLDIDSPQGKGLIGEAVVAKVRKLDIIAIKSDHFNHMYDLSLDIEYNIIQVKTRAFREGKWGSIYFDNREFDHAFVICLDKYRKIIERLYAIPTKELFRRSGAICIIKDPSRGTWYHKFRIDEKHYNDAYVDLMSYLGCKKYFGIEDIKNWLKNDGDK